MQYLHFLIFPKEKRSNYIFFFKFPKETRSKYIFFSIPKWKTQYPLVQKL